MAFYVSSIVALSVQSETRETYATGWRRYLKFSEWFGTDPLLRVTPAGWETGLGVGLIAFKDLVIIAFVQKLCIEEGLCPGTVSVYLSAIRYHFKVSNLDIQF